MNRQFPPEIIQLSVKASLDPYDFFACADSDHKPRYSTLKAHSLLNSIWREVSEPLLVKWVEIQTENLAKQFLEFAEQRGGSVDGVRELYVNSDVLNDPSTLPKLLRSTPFLTNLFLVGGSIDIGDLAPLQQPRRMRLEECSLVGSPSSSLLRLPQLQRLHIVDCHVQDSAAHFLTPASLPQLRHFETDDLDILAPLAQQLEIITNNSYNVDYTLLACAGSLLLLPLPLNTDERLDMLSTLRSLPPFLHIDITGYSFDSDMEVVLVDAMEDLLETKKSGLRVILMNDHEINDSIKSLIQRFEERGVRVQLVDKHLEFEGAIIEMERIREEEKRAAE